MPKIQYVTKRFNAKSTQLIEFANKILAEYASQGFEMTLRQLYYQFVARDVIVNSEKSYKNLGNLISDARLAGLIDWEAIIDRTRALRGNSHWDSPRDIVATCATSYRLDAWEDQPHRLEVWIEKDALVGVIERVCRQLDVPYFSCRGYTSQSEMWVAAQRLERHIENDQKPVILHFGDHDPSGMDMSRDIQDRLGLFLGGEDMFEYHRLALNMEQVRKHRPPPNPAKLTDSRCNAYIKNYGNKSWELDALEPKMIEKLILDNVREFRDDKKMNEREALQQMHRNAISKIVDQLPE